MAQLGGFPQLKLQVCDVPVPPPRCRTALRLPTLFVFGAQPLTTNTIDEQSQHRDNICNT